MIHLYRFMLGVVFFVAFVSLVSGIRYVVVRFGIGNSIGLVALCISAYVVGAVTLSIYSDIQQDKN